MPLVMPSVPGPFRWPLSGTLQVSVEELAEIFKGALSWSELEQVCARRQNGTENRPKGAFLNAAGGAVFFFVTPKKMKKHEKMMWRPKGGVGWLTFTFHFFFPFDVFSRAVWPTENGENMGDVTNNHDGIMGIQWDSIGIINLTKMVIQPIFVWDYSNEMDITVCIENLRHNLRWFQGEIGSFRFVSVPGSSRFLAVRFLTARFSVRGSVPEPFCIIHHGDFMQLRLN